VRDARAKVERLCQCGFPPTPRAGNVAVVSNLVSPLSLGPNQRGLVCHGDNLELLPRIADDTVDLIYVDPPFNTGRVQRRTQLRTVRDEQGDRTGFGGHRYRTERLSEQAYADSFADYEAFLAPRLEQAHRMLSPSGSLYVHLDYREVHYVKVLLDAIFGRSNFLNEIIWAYDYGGRPRDRWPAKHDTILLYAKQAGSHIFDREAVDRIPYMAPSLVGEEKAARGKLPTDTWWHTIVSPTGKEKLGYPTQKPLGIVRRALVASSAPGSLVCDFFAGSGTLGAAALLEGRRFLLVDSHAAAIDVMRKRFAGEPDVGFLPLEEPTPESAPADTLAKL
jgi:site-specific DNA-methyltransferase (adenine-specific)